MGQGAWIAQPEALERKGGSAYCGPLPQDDLSQRLTGMAASTTRNGPMPQAMTATAARSSPRRSIS